MSNNPLKQYFRRPAIYIKLPSEYQYYDETVIDVPETGELPVYPMTAIDDITAKTPDALFNGNAVVDIIKSCVPDIKDPWQIRSVDLDTILISIKIASSGSELDMDSKCPSCNEESRYGIELNQVMQSISKPDYTPIAEGELKIKFKALTYKEINDANLMQFEISKLLQSVNLIEDVELREKKIQESVEYITNITFELISKTIEYIETPEFQVSEVEFIEEFLKSCDRKIFERIKTHNNELKIQSQMKPVHIQCGNCQHEYDQQLTLNSSDFFD